MGTSSGIDKLDDSTHYPDWAMQMEALLEEKELWDVVTGDEPPPTTGPNSKSYKAYHRKAKLAKAKIILHLAPSQLPHARLDTAKAIWDNLSRIHLTRGFGTLLAMRRRFFAMSMDDNQSMQSWIASVRDAAHRLEAADFEVKDVDLIVALTQGLPESYSSFIVSLDATPVDQLSVESTITRLLNEEFRQMSNLPGLGMAYASRQKSTWHGSNSKTRSDAGSSCGDRKPRSSRCYNCGGKGHMARQCPSPKQEGDRANLAKGDGHSTRSRASSIASY